MLKILLEFFEIEMRRAIRNYIFVVYTDREWPRSACADAQADQRLHCPLIKSLDFVDSIEYKKKPLLEC